MIGLIGSNRPIFSPCIRFDTIRSTKMTPARTQFWSEAVFSKSGSTIPARLRKGNEATKWPINGIVGELLREPGFCGHIVNPQPPVHVWGIEPGKLREREKMLYEDASKNTKPYRRGGQVFKRGQSSSEPILLMAVASWPEPTMLRTDERDRWERRVIRAARSRFGHRLRSVIAHTCESYYHLHLWIDDDAKPIKIHHCGHGFALAEPPTATRKDLAAAYVRGGRVAQDWFHRWVGRTMGWERSLTPRPRLSRGAAARRRQQELEEREELAMAQLAKNRAEKLALDEADRLVADTTRRAMAALERTREDQAAWAAEKGRQKAMLRDALQQLHTMAAKVEDQSALEKTLATLHIDLEIWRRVMG